MVKLSGSFGSSASTRGCLEDLRVEEGSVGAFRFDGRDGTWLLELYSGSEPYFEDWVVVVHGEFQRDKKLISDAF